METAVGAIESYVRETVLAIALLRENGLHSHALVQLYAAIDTLGLLAAPESIKSSGSSTFKSWVDRYLIGQPDVNFTSADLWAARCAVLHTFTTTSDLSRSDKAKELVYYHDSGSGKIGSFVEFAKTYKDGRYIPVDIINLELAFLSALKAFLIDILSDPMPATLVMRLRAILQQHAPVQ